MIDRLYTLDFDSMPDVIFFKRLFQVRNRETRIGLAGTIINCVAPIIMKTPARH